EFPIDVLAGVARGQPERVAAQVRRLGAVGVAGGMETPPGAGGGGVSGGVGGPPPPPRGPCPPDVSGPPRPPSPPPPPPPPAPPRARRRRSGRTGPPRWVSAAPSTGSARRARPPPAGTGSRSPARRGPTPSGRGDTAALASRGRGHPRRSAGGTRAGSPCCGS